MSDVKHWVSKTCEGENCSLCGRPASHKVGEEIAHDALGIEAVLAQDAGDYYQIAGRHNLTAYICCRHFAALMGSTASRLCFSDPVKTQ
jgi:hypothetical protein